ncbi:hypothetical protein EV363DRAFT_1456629 [Boletus edulis]|nr:hypothetical protein EV363DRAFT_1456629 [Boletus edulis]
MSSESNIQSILQFIILNDYLSIASVAVVVYDYTLTFSRELDYVWFRPWTWVSTMFVVVRYIGLYWTMWVYKPDSFLSMVNPNPFSGPQHSSAVHLFLAL